MGEKQPEELIVYVRKRMQNFHPHAVRRVEIPKPDGRMRPLGIPKMCIRDSCQARTDSHFLTILRSKGYEIKQVKDMSCLLYTSRCV